MKTLFDDTYRPDDGGKVFRVKVIECDRGISLSIGRGVTRGSVQNMYELSRIEAKALCHALLETFKAE